MPLLERPNVDPPLPLLITGLAGVAGWNAFRFFRARFGEQVIGIRREKNWPLQGPGIVACDIEDRPALERLFDRHGFASVLNCAGNCALKKCELDPPMAWRINVTTTSALLDVLVGRDVRLVHLSIDLVFSGLAQGHYRETDRTDPVTVYGQTMVLGEQIALSRDPRACVLRISLPMGISFNGHAGAIDWIQARFKQFKPATLYFDEIRTPAYTDCLNGLYAAVLASDLRGIYHAGGPRRLSLYEIAQIVNRVGGYDPNHLMGCPRAQAGPMPPRAGDVTLDSRRLSDALGYDPLDPWPLEEELVPTHRHWHHERRGGQRGSPQLLAEVLYRNPGRRNEAVA